MDNLFLNRSGCSITSSTISFTKHILHILFMRSYKQMTRTYTEWIVAMMANFHPIRNRPIVNFPRKSMGRNLDSIPIADNTISFTISSSPVPASRCFIYSFPKPIYWFSLSKLRCARFTSHRFFSSYWRMTVETFLERIRIFNFHEVIIP